MPRATIYAFVKVFKQSDNNSVIYLYDMLDDFKLNRPIRSQSIILVLCYALVRGIEYKFVRKFKHLNFKLFLFRMETSSV